MDFAKRKQIRLENYDYSGNSAYFITICTFHRIRLFDSIVGANLCVRPSNADKLIEKWLFKLENKYKNVAIDKYVIMPDHIHFILQQTGAHAGAPLPEIIKWFKTQTTDEYIKGVKSGVFQPFEKHIWERNYYEHIIRNQNDYNEIWKYIDENPLKYRKGEPMCSPE